MGSDAQAGSLRKQNYKIEVRQKEIHKEMHAI